MAAMKSAADRQTIRSLDRSSLEAYQLTRLEVLFREALPQNSFYKERLPGLHSPPTQIDQLAELPFTTKAELAGTTKDGWAAHRTFPVERYTRFHQTSGTHGEHPLILLDTPEDWQWWIDCWHYVLDAAEITATDRCFLAFSFGPFIGFWSAFDALADRGSLVLPGGGLSSLARLQRIEAAGATCLLCTPSYALRLAEVAAEEQIDLRGGPIKKIIVAGEPGGSIASVRERIESIWGAQVLDHAGATEIGAWGFGKLNEPGLYINEGEFIAEFIDPQSDRPVAEGELSELVITALGRAGHPLLRYRTGDLVRHRNPLPEDATRFVSLVDGILGRTDEMVIIRGVNILPSAVEQIVRQFDIPEFRLTAKREGAMDNLSIEVETTAACAENVRESLQVRFGLRIDVTAVPEKSLPRFEGKAKRFVDLRKKAI